MNKTINEFFKEIEFYYVGGCVRDKLMNIEPKDYDLITPLKPNEIEEFIKSKGRRAYLTGKRFGTLGVKLDGQLVEITTFRTEAYEEGSRKPKVEFTDNLIEDIKRRDFTINSLVKKPNGKILNFFNGVEDIENKYLRAIGHPNHRFKEDPLRILRAIRFAAKYNMVIEPILYNKIKSNRWRLYTISKERIIDEIDKILLLPIKQCADGLLMLWETQIMQVVSPELYLQFNMIQDSPHHNFYLHVHTVEVVKQVKEDYPDSLPHLWSALLHDIGKPFVKEKHKDGTRSNYINHDILGADLANDFCIKYKFSNKDKEFIVKSVEEHIQENSWLKEYDNRGKK